jgi:hypothetical protein
MQPVEQGQSMLILSESSESARDARPCSFPSTFDAGACLRHGRTWGAV